MAHKNQIEFIKRQAAHIQEPILIIGSKLYDYDPFDLDSELKKMGFTGITGIDIATGPGVDEVVDITDTSSGFIQSHQNYFNTIICMEVLTNVTHPFKAAYNANGMLKHGGTIILSECFVRKLSRMPVDYWRFSYDGLKQLFEGYTFKDNQASYAVLRQKDARLQPFIGNFEEFRNFEQHKDESRLAWIVRMIAFKFLAKGPFKISRMLPEQTIYAIGTKSLND